MSQSRDREQARQLRAAKKALNARSEARKKTRLIDPALRPSIEEAIRRQIRERGLDTTGRMKAEGKAAEVLADLSPVQRKFVDDPSPWKVAICGRQSGKTHALVRYLFAVALSTPNSTCVYVALSRQSAKGIVWNKHMLALNRSLGLNGRVSRSALEITFPNGSVVMVRAANDEETADRLRGNVFDIVVVDECQSMGRTLHALIQDVLEPTMMHGRGGLGGVLILAGTPGLVAKLPPTRDGERSLSWFGVTTGADQGYSVHHWNISSNSAFSYGQDKLDEILRRKGWTEENPTFRREWLGEWVQDTSDLVYDFDENLHSFLELPERREWLFVCGIDFGFRTGERDSKKDLRDQKGGTSLSVWAFSFEEPVAYEIETFKHPRMDATDVAHEWRRLARSYGGFWKTVGDHSSRQLMEELRNRHGVPIEDAEKFEKSTYQRLMRDDLRHGRIRARSEQLLDEWSLLYWDDSGLREAPGQENHCSDAALYAWRALNHYLAEIPSEKPTPGSREWNKQQMDREIAEEIQQLREQEWDRQWWGN